MLHHIIPMFTNSTNFPFHSKMKSKVLPVAHGYIRLYITCLPTAPTMSLTHLPSRLSLLHSVSATGAPCCYSTTSSTVLPWTLPFAYSTNPWIPTQLAPLVSLDLCTDVFPNYSFIRELSSMPIILLSFTFFLSFLHSQLQDVFLRSLPNFLLGDKLLEAGLCFDDCHTSSTYSSAQPSRSSTNTY